MNKPFILGIPNCNTEQDLEFLNTVCNKYQNIIGAFYAHPPFGGKLYADRKELSLEYTEHNINFLKAALAIIKAYKIPIQVTFNQHLLKNCCSNVVIKDIYKYINLFGMPDLIITYDKFAQSCKNEFPELKLVRTYNDKSIINATDDLGIYDYIVLGEKNSRNLKLFTELKQKFPNIKLELILNTCNLLCTKDCTNCAKLVADYIARYSLEKFLAITWVTIEDSYILDNYIDFYKLCTVPNINMLESFFIGRKTENYGLNEYLISLKNKYNLDLTNFNLDKFNNYRKEVLLNLSKENIKYKETFNE